MTKYRSPLFALVLIAVALPASPAPLRFDFVGSVDSAEPIPNVFGLAVGDQIFGSAFVPDANLSGARTYTPNDGLLELSFTIGNVAFDETQDFGYADFPTLSVVDGAFVGLNFFVLDFEFLFSAFDGTWSATYFDPFDEVTEDVFGTFAVASVPEPAPFALLGTGLFLLAATRRRPLNARAGLRSPFGLATSMPPP